MKNFFVVALAVCSFSLNIHAIEMNDVSTAATTAADKTKSAAITAKDWAKYQACILASKFSSHKAEDEKKCVSDLLDSKNARIQELEEEVARLKAASKN